MSLNIGTWNVDPNIPWVVLLQVVTDDKVKASLYTSKADALASTNLIAEGTSSDPITNISEGPGISIILSKKYVGDFFLFDGYEYVFDFYDDRVYAHLSVIGANTDPARLVYVGTFYDLPEQEHAIYKNTYIAVLKATQMIDEATHLAKAYDLSLDSIKHVDLNEVVRVTSSLLKDTDFTGVVESFSIEGTVNSLRTTSLKAVKYEVLSL